jgi:uncharacterized protein
MENFTPVSGLIGGLMIGLSASALFLLAGRIAGISGIVGGALGPLARDSAWRIAFVVGLIAGPLLVGAIEGGIAPITPQGSLPVLIAAGLLVGFGTRLGGGCTSGHGVCGIARGSPRSLAAAAVFFAVALATVYVVRHMAVG